MVVASLVDLAIVLLYSGLVQIKYLGLKVAQVLVLTALAHVLYLDPGCLATGSGL